MISLHVDAVCLVRDGCTGRVLSPGGLCCTLDGAPCRPVSKPEGYLVFTGLTPGLHRLTLRGAGFQEERVELAAGVGPVRVLNVTLKPGAGYPLRPSAARLRLSVARGRRPAPDCLLWLAVPGGPELKVAQAAAEAGSREVRLYWKGRQLPAAPGDYLLLDGGKSEMAELLELSGETGTLSAPLRWSHKRGVPLLSAQRCRTGGDGTLCTAVETPCTVEIYEETAGLVDSLTLSPGENECRLVLPGGRETGRH